jgi:hypothetical protein
MSGALNAIAASIKIAVSSGTFTKLTQISAEDSSGTGATTNPAAAFNCAAGEVIVVGLKWEGAAGTASVPNDTAGNVYTALTKANNTTQNVFTQLFYCLVAAANAANVVAPAFPTGATFRSTQVFRATCTGTPSFVAEGVAIEAVTDTNPPLTPAFTAGQYAVAFLGEFAGTTSTPGSGWTEKTDTGANGSHSFDRVDNPGGTITANCTLGTTATWAFAAASFHST